jgi:hypothetical protein
MFPLIGDRLILKKVDGCTAVHAGLLHHLRSEEALVVKHVETLACPEECLLCHIFRFDTLVQDAITDIEHAGLITYDELAKRIGVTATGALDQVAVGRRTHG